MSVWEEQLPGEKWLVGVRGRVDQNLSPLLEEQLTDLLERNHHHLVVDLSEATYINSGGLRCLVSAWRRAKQQDGHLVLFGLNNRLQEIFTMIGFDQVFQIYQNREDALDALDKESKRAA